jgi:hypothetical protein
MQGKSWSELKDLSVKMRLESLMQSPCYIAGGDATRGEDEDKLAVVVQSYSLVKRGRSKRRASMHFVHRPS